MRLRTDDESADVVQPVADGDLEGELIHGDRRAHSEAVDTYVAYISDTTHIEDPQARVEYDHATSGEHAIRPWGL